MNKAAVPVAVFSGSVSLISRPTLSPCVLVFSGCCNKAPQTGRSKQQRHIVSQPWRTEVQVRGVWQGWFLRGHGENLFLTSLPVSASLLGILGFPWPADASFSPHLHAHVVFSLRMSMSKLPLFIRNGLGSTLLEHDSILTNYSWTSTISQ